MTDMKDALTITLVQTQLAWEDKAANLQMLEEKNKKYFRQNRNCSAAGNVFHRVQYES